jgi:hypothetical protein
MSAPWVKPVRELLDAEFQGQPPVCVLATADARGTPTARCMVCRQINNEGGIVFTSDRRTRKDQHLRDRPECEVVFWLEKSRTQIRVTGRAAILDGQFDRFMREEWWDNVPVKDKPNFVNAAGATTDTEARAAYASAQMPQTFEVIVVYADAVHVDDLSSLPPSRKDWTAK